MTTGHKFVAKMLAIRQRDFKEGQAEATALAASQIPKIDVLLRALTSSVRFHKKGVYVTFKDTAIIVKETIHGDCFDCEGPCKCKFVRKGTYQLGAVRVNIHTDCADGYSECINVKFNRRLAHSKPGWDDLGCGGCCFGGFRYPSSYIDKGDFYGLLMMLKQYTESAAWGDTLQGAEKWIRKYRVRRS